VRISVRQGLAPACVCHVTGAYFLYKSSNVYRDIAMQQTAAPQLSRNRRAENRSVSPVRTSSSIGRLAHHVLEHEAEAEGTLKGCVHVCRL